MHQPCPLIFGEEENVIVSNVMPLCILIVLASYTFIEIEERIMNSFLTKGKLGLNR